MYHVGKVIKVLAPKSKEIDSADDSTQALASMWDENLIMLDVKPGLSNIREGDIVVVDYKPISERIPQPKMEIIKILRGDVADKVWREYKEYYEKVKRRPPKQVTPPQIPGYR
jgi:SepF-like predicted cell division protein (DUF552 family)